MVRGGVFVLQCMSGVARRQVPWAPGARSPVPPAALLVNAASGPRVGRSVARGRTRPVREAAHSIT
jgi:hypothetical protein